MKTFKQFFEDSDTVYDVAAKPETDRAGWQEIGQADQSTLDKIKQSSRKYVQDAKGTIEQFLSTVGFKDKNYTNSFEKLIDKYNGDYTSIATFLTDVKPSLNILRSFGPSHPKFNFYDQVKSNIQKYFLPEAAAPDLVYNFYVDLCTIAHAQGRVGVGECEFMLSVLTEGIKGDTGDIATEEELAAVTIKAGGVEYEIGTQSKVISTKVSDEVHDLVPGARKMRRSIQPGDVEGWTDTNLNNIISSTSAGGNKRVDFRTIERRAQILGAEEIQAGQVLSERRIQLFGTAQLYKYIINHGDTYVVIFNAGSGTMKRGFGAAYTECRYFNVADQRVSDLVRACYDNNFYKFTLDGNGIVRIEVKAI